MKKVAIIGHFGGNESFCDGQTVKTKNLEELLLGQPDILVRRVDTYYSRKNKIGLLLKTVRALFGCEDIFLLVAENGMRVFLPLLYYINKITKRNIYHYVIGSELLALVDRKRRLVRYLNSFKANWFEYEGGTKKLLEMGVKNASTLPNFKNITPVNEAKKFPPHISEFRFCTFSRVMLEKGITDAVMAIDEVNKKYGRVAATLDVYGPVDPSYQLEFDELLRSYSDFLSYKGVKDSQRSVEVLSDYYALLFPTRYEGEGMPGTVIDAFAAGVPVIATDWNANSEIIGNMKNGIIYPSEEIKTLFDAILWSVNNVGAMNEMRIASRREYTKYMPSTVLDVILGAMSGS